MSSAQDVEELFHRARAIADPRERAAFVERSCGDSAARARLERLLAADQRATGFLEAAPSASNLSDGERVGERVGRFQLLERIGEGGFGEVWMAEQLEPVKRKVALKVLKLGMDTKAVVARFEAERQALALMEHSSIAKVFDAGVTASGQPYFAMELVKGLPITTFCDDARLRLEQRLELFVTTCRALQHAHHKGVIHRDVKPSNVLVTLADGAPLPKVIDFGIAKATGVELTDKTLCTGFQQVLGTPEYMAPEQTALGGVDIDTRADVYSLGVLLYELLTGAKPHDLRAALERGYDEVLRTIRESEPTRPSTRASSDNEHSRQAATRRALAPRELASKLSGDLDWIVLKALEKDRARRYDTASALADDVERYLRDEPVLARPPSASYQLSKFVRRHRWQVAAASALAFALLAGIAASTHFALRAEERRVEAERARRDAEASAERATAAERDAQQRAAELEQLVAFQGAQIEQIDPESMGLRLRESLLDERRARAARAGGDEATVAAEVERLRAELQGANLTSLATDALDQSIFEPTRRAIDEQFESQPLVRASLLERVAQSLANLGRFEAESSLRAEVLAVRERELGLEHELTLRSRLQLLACDARGEHRQVRFAELEALLLQVRTHLGADHELEQRALSAIGTLHTYAGDHVAAEAAFRAALEGWRRSARADDALELDVQSSLGSALISLQRESEGVVELEQALEGYRRLFGEHDRRALSALHSLSTAKMLLGRTDEALEELRQGLALARRTCGDDHTLTLGLMDNLAGNLLNLGRVQEAEPLFVELVERLRRVPGAGDVELHQALARFGRLRSAQRRYDDAAPLLQEAYDGLQRRLTDERPAFHSCAHNLGTALFNLRRFEEAEPVLRRAHAARRAALGEEHLDTATTAQALGSTLHGLRRLDESAQYYGRALATLERELGADHERVVRGWRNLGVIEHSRRDFAAAARAYTRSADAVRRSGAVDAPELHADLALVAACELEADRWTQAEAAADECRAIRERALPEGHWARAHARNLLGGVRLGQGRLDEARALLVDSAEQLCSAKDAPVARAGQLDSVADAAERAARLFDALDSAEPGAGHAAQAQIWRARATARRALAAK